MLSELANTSSLAAAVSDLSQICHIFPQDWCKKHGIKADVFDSIINKTPLSYRTNRIIGGAAPSDYLGKLAHGNEANPPIDPSRLDEFVSSHLIDPTLLRSDDFASFMIDRQKRLLGLITSATGKVPYSGDVAEEGQDAEADAATIEAERTITAA
jgi:hypothetical protein